MEKYERNITVYINIPERIRTTLFLCHMYVQSIEMRSPTMMSHYYKSIYIE